MNLIKRIQNFIHTKHSPILFEINEENHTRLTTFNEWYREYKENIFINKIASYGSPKQLLRIHSAQNERKK